MFGLILILSLQRQVEDIGFIEATEICTLAVNGSITVTQFNNLLADENPDEVIKQCIFDVDVSRPVFNI